MKAKKVAIVYQGAKFYGGIEKYLEQLFCHIDKDKFELTLVSLGEWELGHKISGKIPGRTPGMTQDNSAKTTPRVVVVPFCWYSFNQLYDLSLYFKKEKYDLVVSQGMVANFFARISSYFAKIPNLVVVHSDYDYDFHGAKKALYWLTFKAFDSMTIKYIVVSKYLSQKVRELGVAPGKIKVVYNGVEKISVKARPVGKTLILGTMGRLHYTKGYHNLIHAVKLLENEEFKLVIYGEGEERTSLTHLIRSHHLTNKVELMGHTGDLADALAKINIYVQSSLSEGFGIAVVDAMYAEKPIVVTPAGGLQELITDGRTGLVAGGFTPEAIAAAIKPMLHSKSLREKLGKEARAEAIKRFDVEKWARETEKVLLEAME